VREALAGEGAADPDFPIGPNSPPEYIDNSIGFPLYRDPPEGGQLTDEEKGDGTINMLWIYYQGYNLDWAVAQQEIAARYGWRIIYNTNASIAGSELDEIGIWHCQQEDALFVTWWSWAHQNQVVSVSELVRVRQACEGNAVATSP